MKRVKLLGIGCLLFLVSLAWAQEDRIGFPKDYQKTFQFYHATNNEERKTLREIWINSAGAKTEPGKSFPHGTVIIMLGYRSKSQDGQPLKDDQGLYVKDALARIDVMRKEKGYGTIYGDAQSGEWEYNTYNPRGDVIPGEAKRCAQCHQDALATDYVFSAEKLPPK